jgi:hypothetical protein
MREQQLVLISEIGCGCELFRVLEGEALESGFGGFFHWIAELISVVG